MLAGCGEVVWETPTDTGGGAEGLTIRLVVASEDSVAVAALGWGEARAIPEAEVWLERITAENQIETDEAWVGVSDADGVVRFEDLERATYRINGLRILGADEVSLIPPDRPLLRAFGGASLASEQGEFDLVLRANRTGLLFSEIAAFDLPGIANYNQHAFLEIYNNSNDVIYLDSSAIGRAYSYTRSFNCEHARRFQNDLAGIWSRLFQRFPGSGTTYPLLPGEAAVVATDAIDHQVFHPELPDLTVADFEMSGTVDQDPDNPAVPNLIDAGPRAAGVHDLQFLVGWVPPFLFGPVDVSQLPRDRPLEVVDDEFVQVPHSAIRDAITWLNAASSSQAPLCGTGLHEDFHGQPVLRFREPGQHLLSYQRRSIGTAETGWTILMDTNSAVDFIELPLTIGFVEDPPF